MWPMAMGEESVMWAQGVVPTLWPSGELVGDEELTETADCHLTHT